MDQVEALFGEKLTRFRQRRTVPHPIGQIEAVGQYSAAVERVQPMRAAWFGDKAKADFATGIAISEVRLGKVDHFAHVRSCSAVQHREVAMRAHRPDMVPRDRELGSAHGGHHIG